MLLILQPFAIFFSSSTAHAVQDESLTQKVEIQPQHSISNAEVALEKPSEGKPHDTLKPASFHFTWTPVKGEENEQITYRLRLASELTPEGDLEATKTHLFPTTSATFAFADTHLNEGKWYWQVQAIGEGERTSEWSDIWHVTVDASLPMITISQPNGVYGGPQTMQIPFSAEVTDAGGIKRCVVMQDDGTALPLNDTAGVMVDEPVTHLTLTGTISAASLSEATHGITVIVEDNAGNESQKSQAYFVDKTTPQLTPNIIDDQKLKGIADITLVTDDTTLQTSSITVIDEANTPLTLEQLNADLEIATAETKTLKWDTRTVKDGSYRLRFFARDAAGNETTLVKTITVNNSISVPGTGIIDPVDSGPAVDPLLDQLSKQLTQPFPAPQGLEVAPTTFTNATEGMSEEVIAMNTSFVPETDRGIKPIAVTPTESGWRILGILWYWWLLTVGAFGVVIFKWRSIWDATTLVLRK